MITKNLKKMKMHNTSTLIQRFRSSTVGPLFMLFLMVRVIAEPIKLHPIGDSTTNGYETESAWRYYLYKKIVENGCDSIDFVGSLHGPTKGKLINDSNWDKDHDGHRSSKASQILNGKLAHGHKGSIKEWAPKFQPHIAVIYLATNDIRGRRKTVDIIKTFEGIIQVLRDARKEVKIVVCQIPYWKFSGYGGSKEGVDALNAALPTLKDLGTEISPIKIVDLNSDYKVSDHRDGIHPGPTGAPKIADRVYEAIAPWVNDKKITASKKFHVINQTNRAGSTSSLRLSIQDNMPARIWISRESLSGVSKGQGYLITGRKITTQ